MTQRRRIPFILLAALAMVFALATSVLAAGELNIKCDDRTVDLKNDDTFEVAVKSSGTSTYATGMVDVEFDSDVFELTNIKFNTSIAPNNATYLEKDKENAITDTTTAEQAYEFIQQAKSRTEGKPVVVTAGQFRVDFGDDLAPQNFTANNDDVLFTLTFKINKATTKEGPFTITLDTVDASYLDAEGNLISAVNLEDGTISKGSGAAATITITNYANKTIADNISISIGDKNDNKDLSFTASASSDSKLTIKAKSKEACMVLTTPDGSTFTKIQPTATDIENTYEFDVKPVDGMEIVVALKGDINLDGVVKANDATQIDRKTAGNSSLFESSNPKLNAIRMKLGDIVVDGIIKSNDATQIDRHAAGNTSLIVRWN